MALSKLYKNGNSTVVAIPAWVTEQLDINAGDEVEFWTLRGANHENHPIIFISKPATHAKPKATTKR